MIYELSYECKDNISIFGIVIGRIIYINYENISE